MPDITDYIGWRGDLPLSADPFGEADNLILSELAYLDFDGVLPEDPQTEMTLTEAAERYFDLHSETERKEKKSLIRDPSVLLREMKGTERYGNITLFGYCEVLSESKSAQMAAVSFRLLPKLYYTAFRGTDNTLTGWKEDFMMSYLPRTEGQKQAARYLSRTYAHRRGKIMTGGHSKGGNFAVYAAAFCNKRTRAKILRVYSNDGPGFREEILTSPEYLEIMPRIVSIVPEDSIVGVLLGTKEATHIVKSSQDGIMAHEALSWQIYGKHFVETGKRSSGSEFVQRTIARWISMLSDEEREAFVDQLFDLITNSGLTSVESVLSGKTRAAFGFLRTFRQIPREEQIEFADVVMKLIKSGTMEAASKRRREEPE